ncbi:MAG: hypothetical protein IPK08_08010 [Bacteroidetes bacterium]|nr:hypothetical protein [Bacteroidota bacterium]
MVAQFKISCQSSRQSHPADDDDEDGVSPKFEAIRPAFENKISVGIILGKPLCPLEQCLYL